MDGPEPHLRQLERRRGARGDGPRDRAAVVPQGREIARLDLDALGSPRPGLAQRPILERHGASGHDEAVDRDVERDTAGPGAVKRSETFKSSARRTMRTVGPSSTASANQTCPRSSASGRTRASNRSTAAKSASSSPSKSWSPVTATRPVKGFTVTAIDPHRAVREALEAGDDEMADHDRPGERRRDRGHRQRRCRPPTSHRRGPEPRRIVGMADHDDVLDRGRSIACAKGPYRDHSTWEARLASDRARGGNKSTVYDLPVRCNSCPRLTMTPGAPGGPRRIGSRSRSSGSMPYSGAGSGPSSCRRRRMR